MVAFYIMLARAVGRLASLYFKGTHWK